VSPQPPVDGRCDECGFDYDEPDLTGLLAELDRQAAEFGPLLAGAGDRVARRPEPEVWSALEYACHVRDVLFIQRERIGQTLAEDKPVYVPMNREQRLVDERYDQQDPSTAAADLRANAGAFVAAGEALDADGLRRTGIYNYPTPTERTLFWLLHHTAHEVRHHLYDVRRVLELVAGE
jgi:DinB superfamily